MYENPKWEEKVVEDKITKFLEHLENDGIQINGETAMLCNDGAVLFIPNERGAVDIVVVRNLVKVDYNLDISDDDVRFWATEKELERELGGES